MVHLLQRSYNHRVESYHRLKTSVRDSCNNLFSKFMVRPMDATRFKACDAHPLRRVTLCAGVSVARPAPVRSGGGTTWASCAWTTSRRR